MTTWVEPNDYDERIHVIVEIDIEKFDEHWKENPFYVPSNQSVPTNLLKYSIWKNRHNSTNYRAEMSTITLGDDGEENTVVGFVDGRHRYSTYRDQGNKTIPMMIKKDELSFFNSMISHKTSS